MRMRNSKPPAMEVVNQGERHSQYCRGERGPSTRLLVAGYYIGNAGEDKGGLLQMGGVAEYTK